ncbi:MAG: hypothetical protein KAR42_07595 [candidate division Zixibacteria bacterium]|nr:hypothetical protein [candidate division Zixibacteria bacterium]
MAKYMCCLLGVMFCCMDGTSIHANENEPTTFSLENKAVITVSGFGDFITTIQEHTDEDIIEIGQAEIDLGSELSNRLSIALGIAYDTDKFTIGNFTIDYVLLPDSERANSYWGIRTFTIGGGQFDIPFGIGWQKYASTDRQLISSPLVVVQSHDEWNDIGGYANLDMSCGNITVFISNGFDFEQNSFEGDEVVTASDLAVGGRLGIKPVSFLTLGASYADLIDRTGRKSMDMIGGDLSFSFSRIEISAEYILHRFTDSVFGVFDHDGYYLQASYNLDRFSLTSRFDRFDSSDQTNENHRRVCSGFAAALGANVEFRTEYQINHNDNNAALIQVVVAF